MRNERTLGKNEIQVRRLDHTKLEHIFWEELCADGADLPDDAVGCKITWAPIHVYEFEDNTMWLLNNEGIGYPVDADEPHKIQTGLRYGNKMTIGGPSWLFDLSLDTIRLCLTDEYVDIESDTVVRKFGGRLEQNLGNNIRSIKQRLHEIEVGTKEITFSCKAEVTMTYTGRVPADMNIPDSVSRWQLNQDTYSEKDREEQQTLRHSLLVAWERAMHNGSLKRRGEPYQHERSVPLDYRIRVKEEEE
tara:strand:+ start:658 stop:1398 length:741 start_codon:yes stop_codon:yes gene_type:complete